MSTTNENSPAFRAAQLGALLARHYPESIPFRISRIVSEMQAATRAARNWETRRCNDPMTEAQEERGTWRIEALQLRINFALGYANITPGALTPCEVDAHPAPAYVKLGGDPRGPCGSLIIPGMPGDGWGDGFAIY